MHDPWVWQPTTSSTPPRRQHLLTVRSFSPKDDFAQPLRLLDVRQPGFCCDCCAAQYILVDIRSYPVAARIGRFWLPLNFLRYVNSVSAFRGRPRKELAKNRARCIYNLISTNSVHHGSLSPRFKWHGFDRCTAFL